MSESEREDEEEIYHNILRKKWNFIYSNNWKKVNY